MAVSTIGNPFQARKPIYWIESSYGGGASGTTLVISKYVHDVKIGSGDKTASIRSIQQAHIIKLIEQANEPTISVEYNPQVGDTFLDDCVDRSSCCTLQSMAFEFGVNTCIGGDNATYFTCVGFKASTIRISGAKNEAFTITVDLLGKSIVTSTTSAVSTGALPADLAGEILQFNVSGSIAKSAGWSPGGNVAYITNSLDITIDNQLTPYPDMGSQYSSYLVDGTMDVEGSVDITLDGGGGVHMGEVLALQEFTLTINMGGAGALKLTLPGCRWKSSEINPNESGEAMMESAPFTCVPSDCASIVSTV